MDRPADLTLSDGRPARDLWTLDPAVRHLNHGSYGAVPRAAQEYQRSLKDRMEANPLSWFVDFVPPALEQARAEVAAVLQVELDRLAFVINASAGVTAVLNSLPVPAPDAEIVVTDHGYGAVIMGVQRFAQRYGITVRVAAVPLAADETEATAAIMAEVTDRTSLIVLDHLTSPTARLLPVAQVCAAARARGITTIVDGAHVPMMIPGAITATDADFWIGNLHKYGCAPRGTAVLVAHPSVAQHVHPLIDSWGAGLPYPARFDQQGTGDVTSWLAAPVALAEIEDQLGWDAVRAHNEALAGWAQEQVAEAFAAAFGDQTRSEVGMAAGPVRLVRLPAALGPGAGLTRPLQAVMMDAGFMTQFTGFAGVGYLRLFAHAYNTAEDYQAFIDEGIPLLRALG